jgi:hypothetical protein
MDHLLVLAEGALEPEGRHSGHAMMASCPPDPYFDDSLSVPFGHSQVHDAGVQKTWDLSKGDLANLLDLSKRLNLDGEITPVMAWGMILSHPRFPELRMEDFVKLGQDLGAKIRCYG